MLEPREDVDELGLDYNQRVAIAGYKKATSRVFRPGEVVELPTDALAFAEYQTPWPTIERYRTDRCKFDPETNDWLVHYVTQDMLESSLPPVYVDVLPDGVALVDGAHRVTAALIANQPTILAQLNAVQEH